MIDMKYVLIQGFIAKLFAYKTAELYKSNDCFYGLFSEPHEKYKQMTWSKVEKNWVVKHLV